MLTLEQLFSITPEKDKWLEPLLHARESEQIDSMASPVTSRVPEARRVLPNPPSVRHNIANMHTHAHIHTCACTCVRAHTHILYWDLI